MTSNSAIAAPCSLEDLPEPGKAYKEVMGIESLQYLRDWGCNLTSSGSGYINISGFIQAYNVVDYINVRLYLQCWDGTKWVDLTSWSFEKYNASRAEGAKALQVSRGYYYRVRATHSLTNKGINEPDTPAKSYSSAIFIN